MAVMSELMQRFLGDIERIEYASQLLNFTPLPAASTAEASDILILDGVHR